MKRSKYIFVLLLITMLFPFQVFAKGSVAPNKTSISVVKGSSTTFKVSASNAAGKVTISSSDKSIATVNKSSVWLDNDSVTVNVKGVKVGTTTIKVVIDAATYDEEVIKKTQTIKVTVTEPKSANNKLSSLKVSPKDIDFNSNKTNYTIVVDNDVDEVKITAKASDSSAKVTGTGTKSLNVYENKFNVVVTAENGSKRTYTITVKRKDKDGNDHVLSSNTKLKDLTVDGYNVAFDDSKDTFTLKVPKEVESIKVNATPDSSAAKVEITGYENLEAGENTVSIKVTAENGNAKTYKLIVTRDDGIPRVKLDELLETLENTDTDTVIVNIYDDNNTITAEMFEKLGNRKLIINKYIDEKLRYSWEINGDDIKQYRDLDTLVEFYSNSDKKMNDLTNYAKYLYFNNHLDTSIFNYIKLKIYVDEEYNDNAIYGYSYEDEHLEKVYDNLKYNEKGYIEIDNIHLGTSLVSQAEIKGCIYKTIAIIEYIIIMAIGIFALFIFFKKKNDKKDKNQKNKSKEIEEE